jgi:ATP-dependent Lon protease
MNHANRPTNAVVSEPIVQLANQDQLDSFTRDIENRPDGQQSRLNQVVGDIQRAGGIHRILKTLPENWHGVLDEFQAHFPNFSEFANILRHNFSLATFGDGRLQLPATLFVGPPGIGKSEVLRWLADRLGLPKLLIDMASAQTSATLAGSDASFSNSQPGKLFYLLATSRTANPLVMLDELDKVSGHENYQPIDTLYSLLEPSSAKEFVDFSIRDLTLDASHINWLATANSTVNIPDPILSRFLVLHIQTPSPKQMRTIIRNLYAQYRKTNSWGTHFEEELSNCVVTALANYPPRKISLALKNAFGSAAYQDRKFISVEDLPKAEELQKRSIGFTAVF